MSATNGASDTSSEEAEHGSTRTGVGPRMLALNRHGDKDRAAQLIGATRGPEAQPRRRDKEREYIPPMFGDGFPPHAHLQSVERSVKEAIPRQFYGGVSESERSSTQLPTIYRVPRQLAMNNPGAYNPSVVSLGFIVSTGKTNTLDNIEKYKMCCVRRLLTGRHHAAGAGPASAPQHSPAAWTPVERWLLHECFGTLRRLAPRIRAAHDPNAMSLTEYYLYKDDDVVVEESLRDGCFVLHRLLKYARIAKRAEQGGDGDGGKDDDDDDDWTLVFGQCWVWGFVTYDLLLLENQIPFFVLQALFELLKSNHDDTDDVLITGALQLFRSLHPQMQHTAPIACRDVHHLLHLFYLSISFPAPTATPGDLKASTRREHVLPRSELSLWVPCAKELEEAGVLLRARKRGTVSFLDVRFHGGVLEIPPLQLYDYSESMFRNLIAFEQVYPATPGHITAYASFMACLITTHEDMRLLHQSGILINHMSSGDRDATRFFSSISAQAHTSVDLNYLAGVMEEVVKYQSGRWPRWRASLTRNYFSNPWVTTSVAAAVVLLCLTVVQTFFAAYAYFKPPASS